MLEQYDSSIVTLRRDRFDSVGQSHGRASSVLSKSWSAVWSMAYRQAMLHQQQELALGLSRRLVEPVTLNLTDLIDHLRTIESSEVPILRGGKVGWDIIAEIQNEQRTADDPGYLLSWDPGIHPRFRNSERQRQEAALQLHEAYRDLRIGELTVTTEAVLEIGVDERL